MDSGIELPGEPPMAHMDMQAIVKQLNVVTGVVAKNLELEAKLTQAFGIINQLQALLKECQDNHVPPDGTPEVGDNNEE